MNNRLKVETTSFSLHIMAMIFMLGKIITRTMNSLSSLQPETTGGSMQRECLVPTSS